MQHRKHHQWNIDQIHQVIKLWKTSSTDEIAQKLSIPNHTVTAMAARIRSNGYDLPKRWRQGILNNLVKEALKKL